MSAPVLTQERLFAFVAPDSPLAGPLEALREQVAARPQPPSPGTRQLVRAEIKGVRTAGGWRLDRFCCCTQTWGEGSAFGASTLYWRDGHGPASRLDLPDEPCLEGLASVLPAPGRAPADHQVLRYVPLRRFTWRADGRVHKVKRRSRLSDSYARASAVARAALGSDVRVPALRGTTSVPCSYRQDVVDGEPLSEQADGADLLRLLGEAGEVHAAFGALPVRDLPQQLPDACLPDVARMTDWVAFLLPELDDLLRRARTTLTARAPGPDADAVATCHGDLVASHLLGRPGRWSVIDLDLAHRGDRYRDVAMFLAALPGDVPALADGAAPEHLLAAAEQAYLDAYCVRWGRALDPRRLAWHRAVAELHALWLMVTKDRLTATAVVRSCTVLERVLTELEHS